MDPMFPMPILRGICKRAAVGFLVLLESQPSCGGTMAKVDEVANIRSLHDSIQQPWVYED